MSKAVLKKLKGDRQDIRIYPIFFDKYFVVKLEGKLGGEKQPTTSLYIQDTEYLGKLFEDDSQKSVVFFNLFNGLYVGKKEERNYRGVMSYSTLLNTYDEILDNQDISQGLIYDKESNNLKDDILQYLTFFHFSRFEANKNVINIKLNPYENIIDDSSVGKHCLFSFANKKVDFNSLAFLTEVRSVLINNEE
ncbi:hypothetical protein [Geminocystis sp. GBBB08]|uniref:hypothetical protein n=1 Tax=Geminocystis sp. GBBB08 TaxID=2604140 RepID=UPI0027E36EBF|nr:hypothetical protein [Geminocystis sp. GBBB08]